MGAEGGGGAAFGECGQQRGGEFAGDVVVAGDFCFAAEGECCRRAEVQVVRQPLPHGGGVGTDGGDDEATAFPVVGVIGRIVFFCGGVGGGFAQFGADFLPVWLSAAQCCSI